MALGTDPFSLLFKGLWDLVTNSPRMSYLIKAGNRIQYNQDTVRDPFKDAVNDADLPELQLVSAGFISVGGNSCGTFIKRRYAWYMATGDFRIHYRLYPVQFALFCLMQKAQGELGGVTWNGHSFIKKVNLLDGADNVVDILNRNINGWTAVWNFEVEMHFSTSEALAFLQTTEP